MTVDQAWKSITSDPMPQRLRMVMAVVAAVLEDVSQADVAEWCSHAVGDDSSLEDVPRIWARAVAVLRLPEDVRRAAEWN